MQVRHILLDKGREIIAINADATLSEAASLLARRRIGAVIVLGEDGMLAGILSERDVVRAISAESVAALARPVSGFMTREITTCSVMPGMPAISIGRLVKRFCSASAPMNVPSVRKNRTL